MILSLSENNNIINPRRMLITSHRQKEPIMKLLQHWRWHVGYLFLKCTNQSAAFPTASHSQQQVESAKTYNRVFQKRTTCAHLRLWNTCCDIHEHSHIVGIRSYQNVFFLSWKMRVIAWESWNNNSETRERLWCPTCWLIGRYVCQQHGGKTIDFLIKYHF